jgi:outer membrane autotransporter protein
MTCCWGGWSRFDGNANAAEAHARNRGLLMGVDGELSDTWQGGAAGGYSITDINDRGRSSTALARNYHAAAYAGLKPTANQPVLRLGGGFTWHDVESTRGVAFGGLSDTNSADYDAWTAQAFADLSQPFTIGKGGSLSPFGTLSYLHQSTNAFIESGGPSALHVDGSATDLATTTLGLRGRQRLSFPHRDIKQAALTGSAGWRHLIGDDTPTSAVSFASGGNGFAVDGTSMARNTFVYDAGLTLQLDANASLNLRYGGELAPEAQTQSLSGEFRWAF